MPDLRRSYSISIIKFRHTRTNKRCYNLCSHSKAWSLTPVCARQFRLWLWGVKQRMEGDTMLCYALQCAEPDSEVYNGAWSLNPCCVIECRLWLWGVKQTTEPDSEVYNDSTEADTVLCYAVQSLTLTAQNLTPAVLQSLTLRWKTEHGVLLLII